ARPYRRWYRRAGSPCPWKSFASQRPIDRSVNAYDTALPAAREAVHAGDAPYPGRSLAAAAPQYMGRPSNSHNQPLMMRIDVPDGDGQQDQLADQDDQGDDAQ